MVELDRCEFDRVSFLFAPISHCVPVFSVLEGNSPGRVFVDDRIDPATALVWTRWGYYYLGGDAKNDLFNRSLGGLLADELIPASIELGERGFILYPSLADWEACLDVVLEGKQPIRLYRRTYVFDAANRRCGRHRIPAGFSLRRIDKALLSDELVAAEVGVGWETVDDFMTQGIGFCLARDDPCGPEVVSICCSIMSAGNSVEIGIRTVEAYRRRDFATLVAGAFIGHCLANDLRPNWECFWDNEPSNALAQKLGFEASGDHPVYYWEEVRQ